MSRPKGIPKTGGRKAGTPNKVTQDVREWLTQLVEGSREQIERDLQSLDPKDRLQALEKFMQYTIPKLQAVEATVHDDGPVYDYSKLTDDELLTLYRLLPKVQSNDTPLESYSNSNLI
jgi:deoxyribodipyrimidine photolyase-like uncharacterized protein